MCFLVWENDRNNHCVFYFSKFTEMVPMFYFVELQEWSLCNSVDNWQKWSLFFWFANITKTTLVLFLFCKIHRNGSYVFTSHNYKNLHVFVHFSWYNPFHFFNCCRKLALETRRTNHLIKFHPRLAQFQLQGLLTW